MAARRTKSPAVPTWGIDPTQWTSMMTAMTPTPAAKTWMSMMTSVWTMGLTAQQVIWLRVGKLASEGATVANQREVQRMVSEKIAALNESATSLATAGLSFTSAVPGALSDPKKAERLVNSSLRSANKAIRPFSTRVKANHKRLSNG